VRRWAWIGLLGAVGLAAALELYRRVDHHPLQTKPFSATYPPRTLPNHTTLVLLDGDHHPIWRSGQALDAETLGGAAYVSLRLPSGPVYTYPVVAVPYTSLGDLEVGVGDHTPTLSLLFKNRGYTLSDDGSLEREK